MENSSGNDTPTGSSKFTGVPDNTNGLRLEWSFKGVRAGDNPDWFFTDHAARDEYVRLGESLGGDIRVYGQIPTAAPNTPNLSLIHI